MACGGLPEQFLAFLTIGGALAPSCTPGSLLILSPSCGAQGTPRIAFLTQCELFKASRRVLTSQEPPNPPKGCQHTLRVTRHKTRRPPMTNSAWWGCYFSCYCLHDVLTPPLMRHLNTGMAKKNGNGQVRNSPRDHASTAAHRAAGGEQREDRRSPSTERQERGQEYPEVQEEEPEEQGNITDILQGLSRDRAQADERRNEALARAIKDSNEMTQGWATFGNNVPRYNDATDIDEWIETACLHRPMRTTAEDFWAKLSLRIPQHYRATLTEAWEQARGNGETKLTEALKELRVAFGDNTTSSSVFQDITSFQKKDGENTPRMISRFQGLVRKYKRKCQEEGRPALDENSSTFKEAFLNGAGLIDRMELPETLSGTLQKARDLLRRITMAQATKDQAAATTWQRKAPKGVHSVQEGMVDEILRGVNEQLQKFRSEFDNKLESTRIANIGEIACAVSSLQGGSKKRRTAVEQPNPGEGPACVMFAKGVCKNGSSCYYLHGDGADQKFCELGRDCRRKGCRFVHTRT